MEKLNYASISEDHPPLLLKLSTSHQQASAPAEIDQMQKHNPGTLADAFQTI